MSTELTTVPSNATFGLDLAVARLLEAGLRYEIEPFPPQPCGQGVGGYSVAVQEPRAPARVPRGSVVRMRLHSSLIPMVGYAEGHPETIVVPELAGLRYGAALERLPAGALECLDSVAPLPATGRDLDDAFVVVSQRPEAGATLPWGSEIHLTLAAA